MRYDILIRNARIYDGSGNPWFYGSVGIKHGRIAAIGTLAKAQASKVVDAQDKVLCPGFIDMHTHADANISRHSSMEQYLRQGVTTIIGGNCGSSRYPIGAHLRSVAKFKKRLNYGLLVGHGTLRRQVIGLDARTPTDSELKQLRRLCGKALAEGAFGVSLGLYYAPGCHATDQEIIAMAEEARKRHCLVAFHMRDESTFGAGLLNSIKEVLAVAEATRARVHVSHLKCLGQSVWGLSDKALALLEDARQSGLDVSFDQYPYAASSTSLGSALQLQDSDGEDAKLQDIEDNIVRRGGAESIVISWHGNDTTINGKNLAEIAAQWSLTPAQAAQRLQDNGGARVISFNMHDDDVKRIMAHHLGAVASDGSLLQASSAVTHPRSFGTFPRMLRKYVREEHTLTLTEAIRKMTSAPALRLGLSRRGLVALGYKADLVVFDPDSITDSATFSHPHQFSQGIELVIVNGKIALQNGKLTTSQMGTTLYKK